MSVPPGPVLLNFPRWPVIIAVTVVPVRRSSFGVHGFDGSGQRPLGDAGDPPYWLSSVVVTVDRLTSTLRCFDRKAGTVMAANPERKRRNNARKSAARELQRKNPGMGYKEALSLTPSSDSLAIARFLHRSEQLTVALENVENAVFRGMRVRRSAPENPYLTVELDGMGELTRLWFTVIARHTPEQIGAMTMAAIAECYHALGECQRRAMDAATLANGLSSRQGDGEWSVPNWSAVVAEPDLKQSFSARQFTVVDPTGSVSVSVSGLGRFTDVTVTSADVDHESLADQIVAVAGLARAKRRMDLRLWTLAAHEAEVRKPDRLDHFLREHQKCPTPEEYRALEDRVFASGSA